jgi:hypothetical protein
MISSQKESSTIHWGEMELSFGDVSLRYFLDFQNGDAEQV